MTTTKLSSRFSRSEGGTALEVLILIAVVAAAALFFVLMREQAQKIDGLTSSVKELNTKLDTIHQESALADRDSSLSRDGTESPPEFEFHSKEDISKRLDPLFVDGSTGDLALAISETANWLYPKNEEAASDKILGDYIAKLAEKIAVEVTALNDRALAAKDGKTASSLFAEGAALMEFYPVPDPKNLPAVTELKDLLAARATVQQKIHTAMRLRYNLWALSRIEKGYQDFNAKVAKVQKWADNDVLTEATATALAPVQAELLDASALELYMDLLRKVNSEIDETHQVRLSKLLNGAEAKRYLEEF